MANAVCGRDEWEALERARPGRRTLVHAGIANEGQAERLARGGPADEPPGPGRPGRWSRPVPAG